jgi:Kef-type K+ transport system membrane component KefB
MHDATFLNNILKQFTLPFANPVLVFMLILFIILLSPLIMGKIKVPAIVGFIIAGIVIGPNGVNLLAKNAAVELFSTIGLLYIMFLAGVELDLTEFKKVKHKSFVFGFLTFSIPIVIGFPVCYYLLHYPFLTSFLTASMFATHTLVAYPIVSRYGISKNEAVAVSVGGTILTDTAVLIMLPVILSAKSGGLGVLFWVQLLVSLSLFAFIIFMLIPPLARWFFNKYAREPISHYVFVLFIVFVSAFLSQLAGIEPIIGAFVAGLALNRAVQQSPALLERTAFVGNAIFIPFFLIGVGMLVDLSVLTRGPQAIIVAVVLTVVALVSKWLSACSTQKIFRYTTIQRNLVFGLSSAHAAATLAIILVGFKAGIIDDNILNGTIILILCTCVAASFATERAAKKLVALNIKDADEIPFAHEAEEF